MECVGNDLSISHTMIRWYGFAIDDNISTLYGVFLRLHQITAQADDMSGPHIVD